MIISVGSRSLDRDRLTVRFAVKSLFKRARLRIQAFSGHPNRDLDFEGHAVVFHLLQRGLRFVHARAHHRAALVERLGNHANDFPRARQERGPGVVLERNRRLLREDGARKERRPCQNRS